MTDNANDSHRETAGRNHAPFTNTPDEAPQTGTAGNAPKNEELTWARQHLPDDPATLIVERKTELIGWGVPARKRERQLTAETMIDRVVIPVIERMQTDLIQRIDALDGRISALERMNQSRKGKKQSGAGEQGEQQ
ncbi:hypothetical protein [Methanoregula sp.]|uniref:hypothetical protein n=1 Tax=Methanoregula sp. TaxID=2052170 RepID=UPI000CA993CE|nr:hypothetical protein [Methanoregula sp.]PKG31803.1 MAG: hypothetical protein CW742_11480 [Methanoregula sp.]